MATEFLEEFSCGILPCRKQGEEWFIFLVQHKRGGHWGFPKGHKEKKETDKQAAFRELLEETGLKEKRLLKEESFSEKYVFLREGKKIHKRVVYFLAEVKGTASLQKEEILQGKWFSLKRAREKVSFEESKIVLGKAISCLEGIG